MSVGSEENTTEAGCVRRRRRRSWSASEKRRIVSETLEPGVSVSVVARRHDVNANQVFAWRRQLREGLLGVEEGSSGFVPVVVENASSESQFRPDLRDCQKFCV
jgi:transposase